MILPTSQRYVETSPMLQTVADRCRVVPLGIVAADFQHAPEERIAELRARYGGPFVFFAGRHRYYKGLEYLVRGAGAMHAPVVIAGEGPERRRLEALAAALNHPIAFPGELSQADLVAHLHACAVFMYPSVARSEAFGIAILEAHACGKPVVATRLGTGTEYANLDGQTGYNVPPRDSSALAEAVNRLLGGEGTAMGQAARERVMRTFSAEDVARREFEVYAEALERRNRAAE
jgi:rhamnosyl/mannosyltransferase